ncbi:NAD(P)/FAD-dependent oxidoreductase [Paenalcaligenes faecalis]|uniref:NAD(P)/FAD-dependent oxidoreductase n=1 Tax=Paenalcaligenes faecalis TaxID=2980099 RepID=UPI0022B96526|nr:FAD/NAD(P)-binding oxidoreductase [Paenalcaligenes faecalis]
MTTKKRLDTSTPALPIDRRTFLQLGAATAAGTALTLKSPSAQAAAKTKTTARIVIAGAGAAGLAAANHLATQLDGASISLIDARKAHYYQPGFTLVAAGIKTAPYVESTTAEYVPKGVNLITEKIIEFDPDANQVVTENGTRIAYDYLILATGLVLDYAAIEGMDESRIGTKGLGSMYHSPEKAHATWQLLDRFADTGGNGVFLRPNTEMKCAGAPLKYTFIVEDHLVRRGNRNKANLIYNSNNNALFSVPIVHEKVRMLFEERDIAINYNRVLSAIDIDRQIATFSTPDGTIDLDYDFINVIPPMRAAEAIRNSPLPWQSGPWAADGWAEVNKNNLRHVRYPNVFAVGDSAGVPKGKTAASVKWQVPVAVDHLIADIKGTTSEAFYDGYTSCPMITRLGRAMLVEFDYHNNLTPSFPGIIAPLEELWISWVMKTMALKPTYISMLRGRA